MRGDGRGANSYTRHDTPISHLITPTIIVNSCIVLTYVVFPSIYTQLLTIATGSAVQLNMVYVYIWAGVLPIEQGMMSTMNLSGGLTCGRGMNNRVLNRLCVAKQFRWWHHLHYFVLVELRIFRQLCDHKDVEYLIEYLTV